MKVRKNENVSTETIKNGYGVDHTIEAGTKQRRTSVINKADSRVQIRPAHDTGTALQVLTFSAPGSKVSETVV